MSATATRQLITELLVRYENDPHAFVEEILDVQYAEGDENRPGIQKWQAEVLEEYRQHLINPREHRRMSIRSGHGVGKSTVLAWIMVHHILFRYPQKTMVTAPSAPQLWDALWAEYKSWLKRLPPSFQALLNPTAELVTLASDPDGSRTSARTSRAENPDALQGVHSEWVLLIADEASGVHEQVFEAASGSMSGHNALTILAGNPVRTQGLFFDTHGKLADMWWTKHVSCFDSTIVTPDFAPDIARRYGIKSNQYRVRVLGEFPVSEDDVIIPFELVEPALARDVRKPPKDTPVVWGVDCARFGNDRTALAKRRSFELLEKIKWWTKLDTMEVVGRIKAEYDSEPDELKPTEINVDVIGIGAGVVDRCRQLGLPVRGINVAESPALMNQDRYRDLRTELWFKGKEWFARRDCKLPAFYENAEKEDDLIRELTIWKYDYSPQNQKLFALSKKDMKTKYGVDSPDLADAFLLTFASDALALMHGSYGASSWAKPLHRAIRGIV